MKIAAKTAENPFFWLGAALVIAGGMKTWLVMGGWLPFNSDEAVVALMARHILGGDRPAFFYGQAYMGSLDAFFVAGAFAVFGEQVWAIRLVQSLLFLVFLVTTAFLGRRIFGSWAVGSLAALLLAVPPVNLALYTTVSLGGYGEALLIGNLILLAALSLYRSWMKSGFPGAWLSWVSLGFFCGLGFWSFGITLVYAVPAWIFLGWEVRRFKPYRKAGMVWVMSLIGALVGSLPWWLAAIQEGPGKLLGELGGSAISGVRRSWLAQPDPSTHFEFNTLWADGCDRSAPTLGSGLARWIAGAVRPGFLARRLRMDLPHASRSTAARRR